MVRQITPKSSLDNLKREAKRWLHALQSDDRQARARLERATPNAPAEPRLRHVQHALAREYGFPGWAALKSQLTEGSSGDTEHTGRVAWFIENACPDHHIRGRPAHVTALHTAQRLLERYPELATDSFYTAIVCGDVARVDKDLAERPERTSEKGGPKGWEPILYLCFTRLSFPAPNDNAVTIARMLLERGAAIDPVDTEWGNTPLGAAVYAQRPRMIELLGRVSRDIWELAYTGNVERLRELFRGEPDLAKVARGGHTPLMWLPPDDEQLAIDVATLLMSHGADATLKNNDGETAGDRARRVGMYRLADLLDGHP